MLRAPLAASELCLEGDLIQSGRQGKYYMNSYLFAPLVEWISSSYPKKG